MKPTSQSHICYRVIASRLLWSKLMTVLRRRLLHAKTSADIYSWMQFITKSRVTRQKWMHHHLMPHPHMPFDASFICAYYLKHKCLFQHQAMKSDNADFARLLRQRCRGLPFRGSFRRYESFLLSFSFLMQRAAHWADMIHTRCQKIMIISMHDFRFYANAESRKVILNVSLSRWPFGRH